MKNLLKVVQKYLTLFVCGAKIGRFREGFACPDSIIQRAMNYWGHWIMLPAVVNGCNQWCQTARTEDNNTNWGDDVYNDDDAIFLYAGSQTNMTRWKSEVKILHFKQFTWYHNYVWLVADPLVPMLLWHHHHPVLRFHLCSLRHPRQRLLLLQQAQLSRPIC